MLCPLNTQDILHSLSILKNENVHALGCMIILVLQFNREGVCILLKPCNSSKYIWLVIQSAHSSGLCICCVTVLVWLKRLWQRGWKRFKGEQWPAVTLRDHNGYWKSYHHLSSFLHWLQPPANWLLTSLLTCHRASWQDELGHCCHCQRYCLNLYI